MEDETSQTFQICLLLILENILYANLDPVSLIHLFCLYIKPN